MSTTPTNDVTSELLAKLSGYARALGEAIGERDAAREDAARLVEALRDIAGRPTVELNPDGVDQAAWSMQLVAQLAVQAYEEHTNAQR